MRNRSVAPVGLLLAVLAVVACKEGGSGGGGATAPAGNTGKIGAALSLTGAAASYGGQQRAGIEAALDTVNASNSLGGVRLEAVVEDDGSTKEQGINVFQKFINQDKVSVILGPTLSTTATAADPLAQQAKVPVLAVSNTAPTGITDIGDYIFRDSLTEAQVIPGAVKKAKAKLGFKTAGVLYGNDDVFTKAGYDVMKKALDDEGVQILETQTFAKPDRDFSAQITSLKGKNPDILLVSALADNAAAIVAQAEAARVPGAHPGGTVSTRPPSSRNAGPAAEGVLVGASWNSARSEAQTAATTKAMQKKGVSPDQFSAQAYTGVLIIAEAIRKSGNKAGRDDIKNGFAQVKDLDTPLGKFSFNEKRDAKHEPSVQEVKGQKFQVIQ
jgi:branched-chain amino acid transport system substrate-binding protein